MIRITSPKQALDYPRLADDLYVIWFGNEHVWPDARRETRYLGPRRSVMEGFALLTMFASEAETFEDEATARSFLVEHGRRRGHPYQNAQITTVAEMKVLRGYDPAPKPEPSLEGEGFEP